MRQHLPLRRRPRVIFANMANELMLGTPSVTHGRSLHAVSPRKLWLAHEGDTVVTPHPVGDDFKRYAAALLGLDPTRIETLSPASSVTEPLARAVRGTPIAERLQQRAAEGAVLVPFAVDRPTLQLAEDLSLPIEGYDPLPDAELVEWTYRLNTKSGFREVATRLGLPVLPGTSCRGAEELLRTVRSELARSGDVIVKLDRSSNGYGHQVVRSNGQPPGNLAALLAAGRQRVSEQPEAFVVEQWADFARVPSVEIEVGPSGGSFLYGCDQRCPNGSFSGMVTPWDLPAETHDVMLRAGEVFGDWAHSLGFRGVCDLDAGVTAAGEIVFTESNFRRTGGTYLHTLAQRLVGKDYLQSHAWIADARPGRRDLDLAAAARELLASGLAFDHRTAEGVVLTADSLAVDGKWRYLVLAPRQGGDLLERASQIEQQLDRVLQLPPP